MRWQQDFTRAFKKCAGMSPSQWRECAGDPLSAGMSQVDEVLSLQKCDANFRNGSET